MNSKEEGRKKWFFLQYDLTSYAVFGGDGVDNLHGHLALQRVPLRLSCQVFPRPVRHLDGNPSDARFPGNLDTKLKREFLTKLPKQCTWLGLLEASHILSCSICWLAGIFSIWKASHWSLSAATDSANRSSAFTLRRLESRKIRKRN